MRVCTNPHTFFTYTLYGILHEEYQNLGIFSLHTELRLLLYLSVLLFTSGIGILIYQNIDSIGHDAIIICLFLLITVSLYLGHINFMGIKQKVFPF